MHWEQTCADTALAVSADPGAGTSDSFVLDNASIAVELRPEEPLSRTDRAILTPYQPELGAVGATGLSRPSSTPAVWDRALRRGRHRPATVRAVSSPGRLCSGAALVKQEQ